MKDAGVKGKSVTLKLWISKDIMELTGKFLGHGRCNRSTQSEQLSSFTDDAEVVYKVAWKIYCSKKVDKSLVRGVGIQISNLDNAGEREGGRSGEGGAAGGGEGGCMENFFASTRKEEEKGNDEKQEEKKEVNEEANGDDQSGDKVQDDEEGEGMLKGAEGTRNGAEETGKGAEGTGKGAEAELVDFVVDDEKLAQLLEMGAENAETATRALVKAGGDIEAAIDICFIPEEPLPPLPQQQQQQQHHHHHQPPFTPPPSSQSSVQSAEFVRRRQEEEWQHFERPQQEAIQFEHEDIYTEEMIQSWEPWVQKQFWETKERRRRPNSPASSVRSVHDVLMSNGGGGRLSKKAGKKRKLESEGKNNSSSSNSNSNSNSKTFRNGRGGEPARRSGPLLPASPERGVAFNEDGGNNDKVMDKVKDEGRVNDEHDGEKWKTEEEEEEEEEEELRMPTFVEARPQLIPWLTMKREAPAPTEEVAALEELARAFIKLKRLDDLVQLLRMIKRLGRPQALGDGFYGRLLDNVDTLLREQRLYRLDREWLHRYNK